MKKIALTILTIGVFTLMKEAIFGGYKYIKSINNDDKKRDSSEFCVSNR